MIANLIIDKQSKFQFIQSNSLPKINKFANKKKTNIQLKLLQKHSQNYTTHQTKMNVTL